MITVWFGPSRQEYPVTGQNKAFPHHAFAGSVQFYTLSPRRSTKTVHQEQVAFGELERDIEQLLSAERHLKQLCITKATVSSLGMQRNEAPVQGQAGW